MLRETSKIVFLMLFLNKEFTKDRNYICSRKLITNAIDQNDSL